MQRIRVVLVALLAAVAINDPAWSAPLFGTLSNFDVINDTGVITRGFEIELEGVSSTDIYSTFGSPYQRYGDPTLVSTGTGTIVRYASAFGASGWAVGTPVPAGPITTGGHALYYPAYGGDANYETIGGEHFGVALNGNPTNTIYRWLLGDDVGTLTPAGTNVKIPAPIWNVAPAANPAAPAAVQAVIQPLPKDKPEDVFGEAIWVKIFVMESQGPAELDQLLVGREVPDGSEPAEIEIEWQLLQAGKSGADEIDSGLDDLGGNSESITRRYEFYKYIGPYNDEGEAKDENASDATVGEFVGAQNAALNLVPFANGQPLPAVPEPGSMTLCGMAAAGIAAARWRRKRLPTR